MFVQQAINNFPSHWALGKGKCRYRYPVYCP